MNEITKQKCIMVKMVISVMEKHKEGRGIGSVAGGGAGRNFASLNRLVMEGLCKNGTFEPLKR